MNPLQPIVPFYFRLTEKPLFGCFHEPAAAGPRRGAVLICQPMGHEYVNSHRALRQLAVRLAESGFTVLRFDYFGTGDSYGNTEDGTLMQWVEDISAAIAELKRRTGCCEVCVIGLRLGATMALLASLQREDIARLILWDPVEDGKKHLQELLLLRKTMLRFHSRQREQEPNDGVDILGFRFSRLLTSHLEQINLLASGVPAVKKVLIIRGGETPAHDTLSAHLAQSAGSLEQRSMPAPLFWQPNPEGSLLVPARLIQTIVSWSCAACS